MQISSRENLCVKICAIQLLKGSIFIQIFEVFPYPMWSEKIHNIPRDISLEEFFPPLYVFIRMDVSYKDRIGYFLKDEFASQILLPNFYLASISIKLTSFILFQTSISRQKQFFSPNIFNSLKTLHQELQFIPHKKKKKKNFHWIWHL